MQKIGLWRHQLFFLDQQCQHNGIYTLFLNTPKPPQQLGRRVGWGFQGTWSKTSIVIPAFDIGKILGEPKKERTKILLFKIVTFVSKSQKIVLPMFQIGALIT